MRRRRTALSAGALVARLFAGEADAAPPAESSPATEFRVATLVPRSTDPAASQRQPTVIVGEGWGCARFDAELGQIWQCWEAGRYPHAWSVPWLRNGLLVGRDRLCQHDVSGLTFRCWHRPRRGERQPREMDPNWEWVNPHGARWEDSYRRGERLGSITLGGTFACLQTKKDRGLFCLGDDRFGQLGSSSPPGPDAGAEDPAFVRGVWGEVRPGLGTWHACGLAVRGVREMEVPVLCWGRGDHGQLGARAPDRCKEGGQLVPCARRPVPGPRFDDQTIALQAGDLFTCVSTGAGIQCWGANRDGIFGVPGSCPAELRRAWPTPDGPAPAPKAACTTKPVPLPGATEFDPDFTAAPRRICFTSEGKRRCLGGVPEPADPKIERYEVSPGSDASACGARGDSIFCWGEKYSPRFAPHLPVAIAFERLPPLGDLAIVEGEDPAPGKQGCQRHRPCPAPVKKIPPCAAGVTARSSSEILAVADRLAGTIVTARGPLGLGKSQSYGVGGGAFISCDPRARCCGRVSLPAVLGADRGTLTLVGLGCSGDESRACCTAPAFGQTVVATGRLQRGRSPNGPLSDGWRLEEVIVCEERTAGSR